MNHLWSSRIEGNRRRAARLAARTCADAAEPSRLSDHASYNCQPFVGHFIQWPGLNKQKCIFIYMGNNSSPPLYSSFLSCVISPWCIYLSRQYIVWQAPSLSHSLPIWRYILSLLPYCLLLIAYCLLMYRLWEVSEGDPPGCCNQDAALPLFAHDADQQNSLNYAKACNSAKAFNYNMHINKQPCMMPLTTPRPPTVPRTSTTTSSLTSSQVRLESFGKL